MSQEVLQSVQGGVCIASGVWVARGDLAYLYLYHVHKRTMIQTYDLSKAAFQVLSIHSSFGVSSLTTIGRIRKLRTNLLLGHEQKLHTCFLISSTCDFNRQFLYERLLQ